MAIYDIAADLFDLTRWYAEQNYNANPTTFRGAKVYDRIVSDVQSIPEKVDFNLIPGLAYTVKNEIVNDTNTEQSMSTKLMHTLIESNSVTTTKGYKIGSSIKNTFSVNIEGSFFVGGGSTEHSIEVSVSGEYNHSSSETKTNTSQKTWEYNSPILVPAKTKVTATLDIYAGPVVVPVTLKSTVTGTGIVNNFPNVLTSLSYIDRNNKLWTDSLPTALLYDYRNQWPGSQSIYVGKNGGGVQVEGKAEIQLELGLYSIATFDSQPLSGNTTGKEAVYSKAILRDGSIIDI
ncbi:ETX/MTX2 family pore-forming toxin Cry64Ba [Bacillus thuringiensis]|uniref:Parasporin 5-1 n=1 Tax=Bacillus thuringiensis TaxID=1428 RepID=S5Z7C6_BACTU|nr:ETX/MTX2 family pore-forming toxin Cry64Ba [Bacillus thuringiensis]AGT29559.1 parasporin 5-1 [Bacillus thuringiensis]ARX70226.1 hypothetical protein BVH75_30365 [Bacillus thuringiensis]MEB9697067.1 ETX/MTX2 family pore-forming toxin Cry64Ba [Bacillus cereus]